MACNWCNSNNGVWTDPETGHQKPCIQCNFGGGSSAKPMKVKGGSCAVVAVVLLGGISAALAGVADGVSHIV